MLLRNIDNAISSLLADDGDRDGRWLSTAPPYSKIAARFIVAAGIALVVAAGSMLSVGQAPVVRDDLKAVTAFALGAGCTLLQRDLPALWTQPDLSAHLRVADRMLRASVADLATACRDGSPGQVQDRHIRSRKGRLPGGVPRRRSADWRQRDRYVCSCRGLAGHLPSDQPVGQPGGAEETRRHADAIRGPAETFRTPRQTRATARGPA